MEPVIRSSIDELDRLIRTPEGRKQLAAEQRKLAKQWRRHAAEQTSDPYRSAVDKAADCRRSAAGHDAQARKYDAMAGSKGLWEM